MSLLSLSVSLFSIDFLYVLDKLGFLLDILSYFLLLLLNIHRSVHKNLLINSLFLFLGIVLILLNLLCTFLPGHCLALGSLFSKFCHSLLLLQQHFLFLNSILLSFFVASRTLFIEHLESFFVKAQFLSSFCLPY